MDDPITKDSAAPNAAAALTFHGKTMRIEYADPVVVIVNLTEIPSDEDWNRQIELLLAVRERFGDIKAIVFAKGHGRPTSTQRKQLIQRLGPGRMKLAIMLDSPVSRAVLRVLAMFLDTRGFHPSDVKGALTYLGVVAGPSVTSTIGRLRDVESRQAV